MNEGRVERRRHQFVAMLGRDLDKISKHVVVADLQALHTGIVGVARLHRSDDEPRGIAQISGFVQRRLIAFPHEAAVALEQRQLFRQRAFELAGEIPRRTAQRGHDSRNFLRRLCHPSQVRQRLIGGEDGVTQASKVARAATPDR